MDDDPKTRKEPIDEPAITRPRIMELDAAQITAGKTTQEQPDKDIIRRAELYGCLEKATPRGILEIELEGRIIFANTALHRMLEYEPPGLIGESVYDTAASEADGKRLRRFLDAISEGRFVSRSSILQVRTRRGDLIHVEMDWSSRRDEQGRITGLLAVVTESTRERQTEAELMESGELFTIFADHLPASLFITDAQSVLQYANKFMRDTFGADKWIGLGPEDYLPLNHAAAVLSDDRKALTVGPLFRHEWMLDKDSKRRCFQTCKFPIIRKGKPALLGAISLDITAQKTADEALRQAKEELEGRVSERTAELSGINERLHKEIAQRKASEEALRDAGEQYRALYEKAKRQEEQYISLLNSSSDAILIYGTDRLVTYLNPSHTRIFGWTLEEARGKRLPVVPEWDRAQTDIIVDRALNQGIPCTAYETQRYTRWRTLVHISLSASPYCDHEGNPTGILVIYRDISARKRAEAALRLMSKVFQEGIDPIIIGDLDGIIVDVNEAAEQTYGWSREDLIGQSVKMVIPPDRHAQVDELQEWCKKGEKIRNVESVRCTRTGRTIAVLMSLSLLTDDQGAPVGIASIAQNLTDLKRTEEQLRDRTNALEQSNQELEQFAYVAAHDLREPLLAVAGYLRVMERRCGPKLDDQGIGLLRRALDSTARMDGLIESLLAYSRIGSEGEAFEPTDFNLIMSRALDNLRSTLEAMSATVTHHPLPTIMANPSQMVQLIQNLVGNAVKFVQDRSPVVSVRAIEREAEWVFMVRDNGIGMQPSEFTRIFLPFERLHSREEFPGTGIGLANCKKIVERHDGRIWVDSTPGEGSTFFFSLPHRNLSTNRVEGNGK